ncbi:Rab11 [Hexamita inflata]|uniref:Rab11 n=1 Tax=Hexamita inflata TaxID=28002 RepID=A0ABP1HKM0_9EUKA
MNEYDFLFKIIVVGSQQSGKSYFINKLRQAEYTEYKPTIGVDFMLKTIQVVHQDKKYNIKLQIWDTAGQERFQTITTAYFRGANGIFLFCNVNDQSSFEKCNVYLKQVKDYCSENVKVMLVGNSFSSGRVVQTDELVQFAEQNNIMYTEINEQNITEKCDAIVQRLTLSILQQSLEEAQKEKQVEQNQNIYQSFNSGCFLYFQCYCNFMAFLYMNKITHLTVTLSSVHEYILNMKSIVKLRLRYIRHRISQNYKLLSIYNYLGNIFTQRIQLWIHQQTEQLTVINQNSCQQY